MFFQQIYQMMTPGIDLTLVIRKTEGQLTVSALPQSKELKDASSNKLVPLLLNGSPQDLDTGFFAAVVQPMQKACGLISNAVEFGRQAERAAAAGKSTAESKTSAKTAKSAKETPEQKAQREKKEKYEKALKRAEELFAAHDYAEALTQYQQARLYATEENQKTVDEKIGITKMELSQGSLFEPVAAPAVQPAAHVAQPQAMPLQQPAPQPAPQMPAQAAPQHPIPAAAPGYQPMPSMSGYAQQPMPAGYPQPGTYPGAFYPPMQGQPMPPMPGAEQPHAGIMEPVPTFRPDEYAGYPDFPEAMLQQPAHANPNFQNF